jgi:hypothetical protein
VPTPSDTFIKIYFEEYDLITSYFTVTITVQRELGRRQNSSCSTLLFSAAEAGTLMGVKCCGTVAFSSISLMAGSVECFRAFIGYLYNLFGEMSIQVLCPF